MVSRLLVPALLFALTGPGFDGCQGGSGPGVVPPGVSVACFTDSDCVPMACEDVRCIGSECTVVAAMRDADFDGHAPPPCGDDCDDADTLVFPGAEEVCDRADQDCDTRIDEDAAPGAILTPLGTASQSLAAAAVGDAIVVTDTGLSPGVRLRTIDFAGHIGAAVPVVSSAVELVDVATTSTGGVVVVGRLEGTSHLLEAYPIDRTAGVLAVHTPTTVAMLAEGLQAQAVQAEPVGSAFVVVWDDPSGNRLAWMAAWPAPVLVTNSVSLTVPLDVASDGTTIAIPSDARTITFYSPADGSVVGMQAFPTGLALEPLSAASADYLVAFRDAFDHQLVRITPTTVSPMHAAPSQGTGLPLRIDDTPLGALVTRFDQSGARPEPGVHAIVLASTLDAVRVSFSPMQVSHGGTGMPVNFDVVSSPAGTAVLTNFGNGGSVLAVLACEAH
jgi:hypothetical protein